MDKGKNRPRKQAEVKRNPRINAVTNAAEIESNDDQQLNNENEPHAAADHQSTQQHSPHQAVSTSIAPTDQIATLRSVIEQQQATINILQQQLNPHPTKWGHSDPSTDLLWATLGLLKIFSSNFMNLLLNNSVFTSCIHFCEIF